MLDDMRIDLVEVEAGMNPNNSVHVPLIELKAYLESKNYYLFGLYEQTGEWIAGEPNLRRVNAVFISKDMIDSNRIGTLR